MNDLLKVLTDLSAAGAVVVTVWMFLRSTGTYAENYGRAISFFG